MFIIHILFSEAPTDEEQAEIQTLFGDKYAPESTDTRYIYIASDNKEAAIKSIFASPIHTKLLDINVSSSSVVATPIATTPLQGEKISTTATTTDSTLVAANEEQKESANGE